MLVSVQVFKIRAGDGVLGRSGRTWQVSKVSVSNVNVGSMKAPNVTIGVQGECRSRESGNAQGWTAMCLYSIQLSSRIWLIDTSFQSFLGV